MREHHIDCHLPDETATQTAARVLAESQPDPAMVHIKGDLGAGKSTLARAFLRALGVTGAIPSPTYTLVERYRFARGEALHLDLYRIADSAELEFLGLDDLNPWVWLVEWPERAGADGLPAVDLQAQLKVAGAGRALSITAKSPLGEAWLDAVKRNRLFPGLHPQHEQMR